MTFQTIAFEYITDPLNDDDKKGINEAVSNAYMTIIGEIAAEFVEYIDADFIPLSKWRKILIRTSLLEAKRNSPLSKFYFVIEYEGVAFLVGKTIAYSNGEEATQDISVGGYSDFGATDRKILDSTAMDSPTILFPKPIGNGNERSVSIEY